MSDTPITPEQLLADGWQRVEGLGFTHAIGPLWVRGEIGDRTIGFLSTGPHSNNDPATVHGGALMTFADIGLGYCAADAINRTPCVTAQLQVQFVARAKVGDLITCHAELVRRSAQLVFVRGLICAGGRTVASADGIWKILEARR